MDNEKNFSSELTDAEAELYDRQIRLWGLQAQTRLRTASVLLIGLNGLGAEIAKNIILAGVKSVTFLDHKNLRIEDTCAQFFAPKDKIGLSRAEVSLSRAQNLNNMVEVSADTENIDNKPDEYFKNFSVICATECTITQIKRLNIICRKYNIKLFVGDVWGTFGFMFADLGTHEFVEDIIQCKKVQVSEGGNALIKEKLEKITLTQKKVENFVPFEKVLEAKNVPKDIDEYYLLKIMLNYREKHGSDPWPSERTNPELQNVANHIIKTYGLDDKINSLLKGDLYAQVSPVCAILGGVIGQEIIKTVSQKDAPHNNLFLFSPDKVCGGILKLGH